MLFQRQKSTTYKLNPVNSKGKQTLKNQKWRDVESILFLKLAGPLMPRSIIITEDQLLLVDEDYTRWPSIGIESELPKMPQFQKKFAHMISDVVNIVRKVINRNKINETKTQHIL